ncbi:MAG: tRNA (adenosine(37)-N6)-threonylcarbamoyltransferase complex ATPase subunit type 1 TsaE [Clostridia bacterium]|nr:tRNA (adenosine(37)-N6)-threonylcarbamoyltransferase complex ATPase subunit type 1 TsaE [Clostridia bacterium]
MNYSVISSSPEDTVNTAAALAERFSGGEIVALKGGLGMGKTCFVKGLAKGLGYKGEVTSPTFAIVNEYIGGRLDLFHFDMYRITGWDDLYSTGYFEYLRAGGVTAVEWSENISGALESESVIFVEIERISDNERKITVSDGESE